MISKSLSHLYILLSSAKLHVFVLSRKRKRSLINRLNSSEPKIDPCDPRVLNIAKFWRWQSSQYASNTQRTEYDRICFHRGLNIFWVINMVGF